MADTIDPRTAREQRLRENYDSCLTKHVIRRELHDGRYHLWRIAEPGTSIYSAEVVILYEGSRLLVHGDVDEVLLGGFSPPEGVTHHGAVLGWACAHPAYIAEKALFPKGREWDEVVALHDLGRMHDMAVESCGSSSPESHNLTVAMELIRHEHHGQEWLREQADEFHLDGEDLRHIGMCVSHSILMAQAVVSRLCELLQVQA
jgi:hypothetical protein